MTKDNNIDVDWIELREEAANVLKNILSFGEARRCSGCVDGYIEHLATNLLESGIMDKKGKVVRKGRCRMEIGLALVEAESGRAVVFDDFGKRMDRATQILRWIHDQNGIIDEETVLPFVDDDIVMAIHKWYWNNDIRYLKDIDGFPIPKFPNDYDPTKVRNYCGHDL